MQAEGADEAASLMRWLAFYALDEQESCLEIVLRLLKLALPLAEAPDGWKGVVVTLEDFYETSLSLDVEKLQKTRSEINGALKKVLELLLAALVQCETKETFVKDILSLEDAVQADLMAIIERIMARGASEAQKETVEVVKPNEKEPGLGSPLYLSRNAVLERMKRENGVLKEENIHMARELETATIKRRCAEVQKEKLVEVVKQLKEQLGADGLRRERSMHAQYDEKIQALQLELDSTKTELQDQSVLARGVPALRDEVDLLRPMAEKVAKMDAMVAKYKAKIDELSGAKDRLRHLEGTNAELVDKNLALESELAKAAVWKRKLKEAKEANTAVEFRVAELEKLLSRERQESARAHADLQGALDEANALTTQLQQSIGHELSANAIESNRSGPPMAGGISEFNPEIVQKLTRLEHENAELKKQIDGETAARIDTLSDEIDDLSRLKESFEGKFFATQETLQSTQIELERTKKDYERTAVELRARIGALTEWNLCLEEDVSAHAKENAALVSTRDRLADKIGQSSDQVLQLTQALQSRDRELITQQGELEASTCRNSRLSEQCERLAMSKEDVEARSRVATQDFEANLARQLEGFAMQMEDIHAERLRCRRQRVYELNEALQAHEAETTRLNSLLESKASDIKELTADIQAVESGHDAERRKLAAAHLATSKELERYQELHSVSNADWTAKEDELNNQVEELKKLFSQWQEQEQALKSTIKSQLASNARLVEKNKTLKAAAIEKLEAIAALESANVRLESRVALLEKERAHFAAQEERKRDSESGMSSYSSQLSTQVTLVAAELEKVLKENTKLQWKLVQCRCGSESAPRGGTSDSGQKAKNYYLTRIQQLEHDKQQVEHKRRELLLVNAKLIQEQKLLHVKSGSLSNQVHELQESVNHWKLRDERRRKKERQPSLPQESELNLSSPLIKRPPVSQDDRKSDSMEQPESKNPKMLRDAAMNEVLCSSQESSTRSTIKSTSPPFGSRKRKLDEGYTTPEVAGPTSTDPSEPTDAKEFVAKSASEPRSKRRLSHFITRGLASDKNKQQADKPSECKQQ